MTGDLELSIVIPLYEAAGTITRAIRSVQAQRLASFEVVVVDDGSTDGGADVVRRLGDPRVRIVTQTNQGVSAARNTGVGVAKSDWVAFLDADDEWTPEHLEVVRDLLVAFPKCDVAATAYRYRRGGEEWDARVAVPRLRGSDPGQQMEDYFSIASRGSPPIWSSAVVVRRQSLERVGGFPVGVRSGEDLLTWARLAARAPVAYSTRPTAIFHLRQGAVGVARLRRMPSDTWIVGPALEALGPIVPRKIRRSLQRYIRWYYLAQASQWIRVPDRREALRAIIRAARFEPLHPRVAAMALLAVLPQPVVRWLYAQRRPA